MKRIEPHQPFRPVPREELRFTTAELNYGMGHLSVLRGILTLAASLYETEVWNNKLHTVNCKLYKSTWTAWGWRVPSLKTLCCVLLLCLAVELWTVEVIENLSLRCCSTSFWRKKSKRNSIGCFNAFRERTDKRILWFPLSFQRSTGARHFWSDHEDRFPWQAVPEERPVVGEQGFFSGGQSDQTGDCSSGPIYPGNVNLSITWKTCGWCKPEILYVPASGHQCFTGLELWNYDLFQDWKVTSIQSLSLW